LALFAFLRSFFFLFLADFAVFGAAEAAQRSGTNVNTDAGWFFTQVAPSGR